MKRPKKPTKRKPKIPTWKKVGVKAEAGLMANAEMIERSTVHHMQFGGKKEKGAQPYGGFASKKARAVIHSQLLPEGPIARHKALQEVKELFNKAWEEHYKNTLKAKTLPEEKKEAIRILEENRELIHGEIDEELEQLKAQKASIVRQHEVTHIITQLDSETARLFTKHFRKIMQDALDTQEE